MTSRADSTWRDKSWQDKPLYIQSERYPIRGGLAEKQRLAQACSVFEGIQGPFILSLACKSDVYSTIFSRIFNHLGAHAGLAFGKECSRTVSFVFEQSGSPFPARELIVLVTRRPELSAILNCATFDHDGYEPPFW